MPAAGHHLHCMGKRSDDAVPIFAGSLLAPWQIDNDGVAALHANRAREHRIGSNLQTVVAHGLGDAGNLALAQGSADLKEPHDFAAQRRRWKMKG